ncbi:hypothetical protein HDU79_004803 [Rhizoclosmatium sp. JEL0117]|nr:hypothetical protein HDU79_004803 [Rhizoclosmatium sp. JEL0117]
MFSDTAEILQLQNPEEIHGPEDVAKLMKKKGISTWAAVTAFSSGAAGAPSVNVTPAITVGGSEDLEEISGADSIPLKDADENIKRNFLIKLARDFQTYGAPSHRIEHHMTQVAQSMSVQADFILFPGLIMISFGGEDHRQHTHFIKAPGGIHMAKLAQVNALCQTLTEKLISIDDAIDLLEGVRVAKGYPDWVILLTYPVSSFCISLLLFQISWLESVIAGFLGLLIGVLTSLAGKHMTFSFLLEFVGSLVATFISRALQGFLHKNGIQFDYVKVTLSSLAVFLPGLSLTIAIIELSTRNMVSGTVRIFGALFIAMLLGFGMTIGSALVLWDSNPYPAPPKLDPTSPLWSLLFFVVQSRTNPVPKAGRKNHDWPLLAATPTAITAIAGFTIGLTGNIYARITNDVAIAPILSGILIQVPGSLSVKSTLGFFGGTAVLPVGNSSSPNTSVVDGVNFTFQMLTICMSLAIGLFLSNLIVFPIRGPKNKYQTI